MTSMSSLPALPTQLSKLLNQARFITGLIRIQIIVWHSLGLVSRQTTKPFVRMVSHPSCRTIFKNTWNWGCEEHEVYGIVGEERKRLIKAFRHPLKVFTKQLGGRKDGVSC